jgi:general secretion pathway protein L
MASTTLSRRKTASLPSESSLVRFFRWWGRELAYFVPAALKERNIPSRRLLWLEPKPGCLEFKRVDERGPREAARVDLTAGDAAAHKISLDKTLAALPDLPIALVVPPTSVLRKRLRLPMVAYENLDQVVRFEVDRQTPYRAEQVFHAYRLVGEDYQTHQLEVDFTALPRHVLGDTLERLRDWGIQPRAIAVSDQLDGGSGYLNLLPEAFAPSQGNGWRWAYAAMALLTVLLVAAIVAMPLLRKREQAIALMPRLEKAAMQARAVSDQRLALKDSLAWHNYLPEKKLVTAPSVAVIEEVSRLLPDNTWLQSFEMRGHELTLQGETGASAKLVGLFERSKILSEANHRSPLVKSQNNLDRFNLAVKLRDIPLDEALAARQAATKPKSEHAPGRQGGQP